MYTATMSTFDWKHQVARIPSARPCIHCHQPTAAQYLAIFSVPFRASSSPEIAVISAPCGCASGSLRLWHVPADVMTRLVLVAEGV